MQRSEDNLEDFDLSGHYMNSETWTLLPREAIGTLIDWDSEVANISFLMMIFLYVSK